MKILILAPFAYGSTADHGGGVACFNQLRYLAQHHQLVFLAYARINPSPQERTLAKELERYCSAVHLVPRPEGRSIILRARIRALLTRQPLTALLHANEEMRSVLRALISKERPDLVIVQFPQMAHYVSELSDVPSVMDVQDSFSVSTYRTIRVERNPVGKFRALRHWLRWVSYERRVYARYDEVLVLTEQDRYGLTLFSPALRVTVCRPAMEVRIQERSYAPIDNKIVFLGSLSRRPNIEALEYFIDSVFPIVLHRIPHATVAIAGRGAPPELLRYASAKVAFLGFVEDLDRFLQEGAVVVVPLLSGGGIKIKVLEAMARGCAVVSTSIGAEDVGAVNGESILIADNANAFADCVVQVMQDTALRARLGKNAFEIACNRFSWAARGKDFEQILLRTARKASMATQEQEVNSGRPKM